MTDRVLVRYLGACSLVLALAGGDIHGG